MNGVRLTTRTEELIVKNLEAMERWLNNLSDDNLKYEIGVITENLRVLKELKES